MCTSWHLGHFSGPPCHSNPHGQAYPKKHVSPSRQRRRARREAARTHKSENVVNDNQPVKETLVNRDAEKVSTVARKIDSKKNSDSNTKLAEEGADKVCPDTQFDGAIEEEIEVDFVSEYAEGEVNDALKELFEKGFVPIQPNLVSRVRVTQREVNHWCNVRSKLLSKLRK